MIRYRLKIFLIIYEKPMEINDANSGYFSFLYFSKISSVLTHFNIGTIMFGRVTQNLSLKILSNLLTCNFFFFYTATDKFG